jgi:hypothetical protein
MNGYWDGRPGQNDTPQGWTNFTNCYRPGIRDIWQRLGSQDKEVRKFSFPTHIFSDFKFKNILTHNFCFSRYLKLLNVQGCWKSSDLASH